MNRQAGSVPPICSKSHVRSRDEAIRKLSEARRARVPQPAHRRRRNLVAGGPAAARGGPLLDDVVRYLNARRPAGTPAWTQERLVRGVRRFIAEGLVEKDLLTLAERPPHRTGCLRWLPALCGPIPRPRCWR